MLGVCYNIFMVQGNIKNFITVDPGVAHGKPVFKGTRIMLYLVLEMLAAGETPKDILKAYPQLTKEALEAAFMFAANSASGSIDHLPS